ncbi:M14 family metallopeptidase [Paenibacillus puerhi]|uniref:M14 family metallopeptidase n=1 Tax=Paenibacillus puerhi TaxID=2692622 RepID=UPI001356B390|nr:M14 family metallopeptidase [Paenibacillus puerhi]
MTFLYVIRRGDTWERIAMRYGLPVEQLVGANRELRELSGMKPGATIRIPILPACSYTVQAGDTLEEVARIFRLEPAQLLEVNPDVHPRRLRIGQTLTLPRLYGIVRAQDGVYGYRELTSQLDQLQEEFPFIEVGSIGRTVLGQPIPYIRIGHGEREVHYNGSFHANEWITSLLLMRFAERYASAAASGKTLAGSDAGKLMEETSLWIVPMVNPDGVELVLRGASPEHPYYERLLEWNGGSSDFTGWKANIQGVDLNDQFPAYWETERDRRARPGPGPRDYTGPGPLSEPEARAMADFTASRNFRLVMAFHTQGREIYWNYRDFEPVEAAPLAARFEELSGYRAVKLTGSDAGYKDWFIREYGRPGFTIEAGYGVNPLPIEQFGLIIRELMPLLIEGLVI